MEIHSREFRMRWWQDDFPHKINIFWPVPSPQKISDNSLVLNFSRQGMFLKTEEDAGIPVGRRFDFALQFPKSGHDIRGKAEVKWIRPTTINPQMPQGMGIHLVTFADQSEATYQEIFESRLFDLKVSDVYIRDIPTINLQTDLATALALFQTFAVQTLVVVEKTFVPIGVVYLKDLFQKIKLEEPTTVTIEDLYKPLPQFLEPSLKVCETFRALKSGVRYDIPIIENKSYLGILPVDLVLNYWAAFSDASYQRILKNYEKSLYEMAHDLRQPIAYILSVQNLLKSSEMSFEDYKNSNFQEGIERNCQNMLQMIDGILDIPRIRAGRIKLVNKKENMRDLVASIVKKNQQLSQKNDILLKLEVYGEKKRLESVLIDSRRLEQVLNNLLSNAVKYSKPSSEVLVKIVEEDEHAKLQVIDTGIGIDAEHLSHLFHEGSIPFDHFNHGDQSTGIGLSIVRRIVTAMGGDIGVESQLGQGTTFTVNIPFSPPHTT